MSKDSSMNRLQINTRSVLTHGKVISDTEVLKKINAINITKVNEIMSKILEKPKPVLSILGKGSKNFEKLNPFGLF